LQRVEAAHVERAAIAEGIRQTLDMLCAAAPLIPHRYRRVVAARLRIDEDVAGALLQDVAELLLAETAELPSRAMPRPRGCHDHAARSPRRDPRAGTAPAGVPDPQGPRAS
jgi:hypothetical protein